MAEQIDNTELRKEMSELTTTPSKYTGLGAAIAAELMIGFWFGIGVILYVGAVDGQNYFVETELFKTRVAHFPKIAR